ncbi:MAG: hypothetical protein AAFR59_06185 [Bacteroidota bacterium]
MNERVKVSIRSGDSTQELWVPRGSNLRKVLLEEGLSPYGQWFPHTNCGGNGICATCGVWLTPAPHPRHWHDRLAAQFGYPRLSCQITVEEALVVERIMDKKIWGQRRPQK